MDIFELDADGNMIPLAMDADLDALVRVLEQVLQEIASTPTHRDVIALSKNK